jgi:hypothetical protein
MWLTLLKMMFSSSVHLPAKDKSYVKPKIVKINPRWVAEQLLVVSGPSLPFPPTVQDSSQTIVQRMRALSNIPSICATENPKNFQQSNKNM